MRELNVNELEQVNGGTNCGAEFVGGCVAGAATGGMSLPLAGQTCLAGGTISVIGSLVKDIYTWATDDV